MRSEPQMYNVLLKKISIGCKICFRKCTPLPLPNGTGWRANSTLALRLSGRETRAGGGEVYLLSIQRQTMLVTVQNAP